MTTPGGPEDREPPDDAEAGVPGLLGEPLAALHPDLDGDVPGRAVDGGDFRDRLFHHPARHRVDRGLADRDREPRAGHRPDPRTRPERKPRPPGAPRAHRGVNQREMGHVRVVARVLDDAGAGEPVPSLLGRKRERGPLPPRQLDGDRVREFARQQRGVGGPRVAAVAHAPVVQPRRRRSPLGGDMHRF